MLSSSLHPAAAIAVIQTRECYSASTLAGALPLLRTNYLTSDRMRRGCRQTNLQVVSSETKSCALGGLMDQQISTDSSIIINLFCMLLFDSSNPDDETR